MITAVGPCAKRGSPTVPLLRANRRMIERWSWRPQEVDLPGAPGPPEVGELDDPRQPPQNMLQSQSKWFPCREAPRWDAPRETVGAAVAAGVVKSRLQP
jgi:hypothetical protein